MNSHPLITLAKTASGAIAPYRIVKGTATDGVVAQSAASTDKMVGCSGQVGAADTERLDIETAGICSVEYGDTIANGDPLTSDVDGKAVPATPGDRICGVAMEKGDLGAIGSMLLLHVSQAAGLGDGTLGAFAAGDNAPATLVHDAVYALPATAANSTVTLPAAATDGTRVHFVADGTLNGHTVQYRDATGPTNLTAAFTASKRHGATFVKEDTKWYCVGAIVSP